MGGTRLRTAARWRQAWPISPAALLVLLWTVLPLAVYLSASSRLPLYALPVFAPLALATGRGLRLVDAATGFRRPGLAAGLAFWCAVLLVLKGVAGLSDLGRDSRRVATRLAAEAPRDAAVLVVDVHANGLPLYGFRNLRWVTLYADAYPLFSPLSTLDQAAADLAAARRPLVVVLEPRRQADVRAALGAAGFSCTARPPVSRVALAVCATAVRESESRLASRIPPQLRSWSSPAPAERGESGRRAHFGQFEPSRPGGLTAPQPL